ncbi:MAG TPA: hypothetical protein VHC44_07705 [Verrucomicrobiae bacterium]|nr:hypothetical protein [Verrucomicrobiae bacterium]
MKKSKVTDAEAARTPDGRKAKTDGKTFLCPSQIASRWGWHEESVRRAIREGRIRSIIIWRRRLVEVSEIERIENEGRVGFAE